MNLKKIGKVVTSKFGGIGPSFYKKKKSLWTAVSQRLRNTGLIRSGLPNKMVPCISHFSHVRYMSHPLQTNSFDRPNNVEKSVLFTFVTEFNSMREIG